jgi:hypothetical protein
MIRLLKGVLVVFWGAVLLALLSRLIPGLLGPANVVAKVSGNVFVALVAVGVLGVILLSVPGAAAMQERVAAALRRRG